jgi:hypothetical protein
VTNQLAANTKARIAIAPRGAGDASSSTSKARTGGGARGISSRFKGSPKTGPGIGGRFEGNTAVYWRWRVRRANSGVTHDLLGRGLAERLAWHHDENQEGANRRIPHLVAIPAAVRFLSVEPMLEPIDVAPWLLLAPHDMRAPISWIIA